MALVAAGLFFTPGIENAPIPPKFLTFPKQITEWKGEETFFGDRIYEALGVDDSVLINYSQDDGKTVEMFVGFYNSQREGDLIHSPQNCLPGGGWRIVQVNTEMLCVPGNTPENIKVVKLVLEQGIQQLVLLYWFQSRGRYIHSEYWQKFYLVWDAVTKNRTDGSFVRLIAPVGKNGVDYTTAYIKSFAETLIPILNNYLPGKRTDASSPS